MLRPTSRKAAALVIAAAALALPAPASANDFQTVYREYKRGGTIKPCRFSDRQLAGAERQTPPDVEQYAPSFLDALAAARERNADCGAKPAAAPAPAPPAPTPSTPQPAPGQPSAAPATPEPAAATPPPAPTVPAEQRVAGVPSPASATAKREDSAPAALWILAVLATLAALAALAAAASWWFGWSTERWTRPFGASIADFAGRAADRRVEFTDWLRTGS